MPVHVLPRSLSHHRSQILCPAIVLHPENCNHTCYVSHHPEMCTAWMLFLQWLAPIKQWATKLMGYVRTLISPMGVWNLNANQTESDICSPWMSPAIVQVISILQLEIYFTVNQEVTHDNHQWQLPAHSVVPIHSEKASIQIGYNTTAFLHKLNNKWTIKKVSIKQILSLVVRLSRIFTQSRCVLVVGTYHGANSGSRVQCKNLPRVRNQGHAGLVFHLWLIPWSAWCASSLHANQLCGITVTRKKRYSSWSNYSEIWVLFKAGSCTSHLKFCGAWDPFTIIHK